MHDMFLCESAVEFSQEIMSYTINVHVQAILLLFMHDFVC